MDQSGNMQNRRQRRANLLMAAQLELSGHAVPVKLRNLSADGALVEGTELPVEGAELRFRKGDLVVPARVVWVRGDRAGLSFAEQLSPEAVLRHVPTPRPRVIPEFRRPGLAPRSLSEEERQLASNWIWRPGVNLVGE